LKREEKGKKKIFENGGADEPTEYAKENFRINCFLTILDTTVTSVK
jgi:hypothetical protein